MYNLLTKIKDFINTWIRVFIAMHLGIFTLFMIYHGHIIFNDGTEVFVDGMKHYYFNSHDGFFKRSIFFITLITTISFLISKPDDTSISSNK